jgi:MFS family permease
MQNPPSSARFAALHHRNFALLWVGLVVSNAGTWMQNVAQSWIVLQLTNSPIWLGLLGLSFALPMIVLPLVGGAIADHTDRIKVLFITQTVSMLTAFALAVLTWAGMVNEWHILVASFVGSAVLAFDNPTRQALVPDLVSPRDILSAISLNSAAYNGAALVGPALAGTLLAPLGAGTLFFLNGVSFLAVIFALAAMKDVRTHSGGQQTSLLRAMTIGLDYALRHRLILALLGLSALAALFGRSYQSLLPIFARDIWHSGPQGYGVLLASAGAGAFLGAFGLASLKQVKNQGAVMLVCGWLFSASLVGFAYSPSLVLGAGLLFVAGITTTIFGAIIATFVQVATPNELRGRVMSLYAITLIGLSSLGAMGTGASAELLGGLAGAPAAILIGAIILGIVLILYSPLFWQRQIGAPHGPHPGR